MNHPTYTTATLLTHRADPCSRPIVLGFALLSSERLGEHDWSFEIDAFVADAIAGEAQVLERLADALPHPQYLIGYDLADLFAAPVLGALDQVDPVLAAHVVNRVARLLTAVTVDLALGGRHARSAFALGLRGRALAPLMAIVVDGWVADVGDATRDLERRALTLWQAFLAADPAGKDFDVRLATHNWSVAQGLMR